MLNLKKCIDVEMKMYKSCSSAVKGIFLTYQTGFGSMMNKDRCLKFEWMKHHEETVLPAYCTFDAADLCDGVF